MKSFFSSIAVVLTALLAGRKAFLRYQGSTDSLITLVLLGKKFAHSGFLTGIPNALYL